jgi:uncharacterized coiled-coil protein SlyX
VTIMPGMSEPARELAALSVEELRAALGRQRAINTELRGVIAAQAELHQAELAARDAQIVQLRSQVAATDAQIAELRSQVVVLGDRVMGLERQAGRDSSNSSKPPSSDSPYTKKPRKPKGRSLRGRSGRKPGKQPGEPGATLAQVDALHAWCGAHGLRDLRAVWEADPAGQAWAGSMADLLVFANKQAGAARAAGAQALSAEALDTIVSWYRGAVATGIAVNQRRRGHLARDGLRLARRFGRHEAMILRFATDLTVAFTNNQAERDIRPVKVQQRASGGCWRTLEGLADFAIVQSYLSTAAKWGLDKLGALHQLFAAGPWLPPALSPD